MTAPSRSSTRVPKPAGSDTAEADAETATSPSRVSVVARAVVGSNVLRNCVPRTADTATGVRISKRPTLPLWLHDGLQAP